MFFWVAFDKRRSYLGLVFFDHFFELFGEVFDVILDFESLSLLFASGLVDLGDVLFDLF